MSTEAQIDLDWAGTNGAESGTGGAGSPSGANGAATASGAAGAAYLTDEEILGMEPVDTAATSRNSVILSEAKNLSSIAHGDDATGKRDSSGNGGPRNDRAMDGEDEVALLGEGAELGDKGGQAEAYPTEMPEWMAAAAADPRNAAAATELWREHQEFRAAFASPTEARTFVAEARAVAEEARAIKELLPGGVRDIVSLREATQSVERIDAALFSGDARAQADVVAEMARVNPAAFRSMFAEAARVMAGLGGNFRSQISDLRLQDQNENQIRVQNQDLNNAVILSEAKNPSSIGRDNGSTTPQRDSSGKIGPQNDNPPGTATSADRGFDAAAHFDAAAYAAFERSTNETVARDVRGSIGETLARVMPEGVAEGAARRIGEDIFGEVHRALAGDRALSEQVAGVLRGPARMGLGDKGGQAEAYPTRSAVRFGPDEAARVAALVAGRAKQLVPSVARRVIGEWTSSVLSTARSKAARQAAAAARVDIAAPGGSSDSMPLRAMSAREVNYSSMSDEQILGL